MQLKLTAMFHIHQPINELSSHKAVPVGNQVVHVKSYKPTVLYLSDKSG